jgi:two-component system, OmpR family, response regulator MprA
MSSARVLVVEDDKDISAILEHALEKEYQVQTAEDGLEALHAFNKFNPNLVILDLGLPRVDGIEVCRRIRKHSPVPILILTARVDSEDRVKGLDAGADDYVVKPFDLPELKARVRSLMRRTPPQGKERLSVDNLVLNPDSFEVKRGDRVLDLTQREFELLEYLIRNKNIVVSREQILDQIWEYDPAAMTNTLDVFVSNLRKKLEANDEARVLYTQRGIGYVVKEPQPE